MSGREKKQPLTELSDFELDMIFGRGEEEIDVVKSVSEAFARGLEEILGENCGKPVEAAGKERDD